MSIEVTCSRSLLPADKGWRRAPLMNGDRVLIVAETVDNAADRAAPRPDRLPRPSFLSLSRDDALQFGSRNSAVPFVLVPEAQRVGSPLRLRSDLFYLMTLDDKTGAEKYLHTVKPHVADVARSIDLVQRFAMLPAETAVIRPQARAAQRERVQTLKDTLVRLQVSVENDADIDSSQLPQPSLVDLIKQLDALQPWALVGGDAAQRQSDWLALQERLLNALERTLRVVRASSSTKRLLVAMERRVARQVGALVLKLAARPAFRRGGRQRFVKYGDRVRLKAPLYQRDLGTDGGLFDGDIVCGHDGDVSKTCLVLQDDYVTLGNNASADDAVLLVPPVEQHSVTTFSFRCLPNNGIRYFRVNSNESESDSRAAQAIDGLGRRAPGGISIDRTDIERQQQARPEFIDLTGADDVESSFDAENDDNILQAGVQIDDVQSPQVTPEFAVTNETTNAIKERADADRAQTAAKDLEKTLLGSNSDEAGDLLRAESNEDLIQQGQLYLPDQEKPEEPLAWYWWLLIAAAVLVVIAALVSLVVLLKNRSKRVSTAAEPQRSMTTMTLGGSGQSL